MPICRRQLAAALLAAIHVAERGRVAAFITAETTAFAPNPFACTSAGVVRHVWRERASEFRCLGVEAIGLTDLLTAVSGMVGVEPLMQEILRAGPHTVNLFHRDEGREIVGAVMYGKPGIALPIAPTMSPLRPPPRPRARTRLPVGQLDLFA